MYVRKFTTVDSAYDALSLALAQDNWKDYFLVNSEGEMSSIYHEKEFVKNLNTIVPTGGFFNPQQAEQLLLDLLVDSINEIAEWLTNGNNTPMTIRNTYFIEPIGYSFDKNSDEQEEYKVKLILRRELKSDDDQEGKTKMGLFVSSFAPVPEF